MPTPPPRSLPTTRPQHLTRSRPRHLTTSRWPWRLGLLAFGLTGVLAALAASATLQSPQPPLARRAPVLGLLTVPAESAARSVAATTGPREPTTAPTVSTFTVETSPRRAVSRPTSAPGPDTAQVSATADTTTIIKAFSTVSVTTQPPVTAPTQPLVTTPTTAAPTTTLATTTSTQLTTTGPTTTGAEPTTTIGPAVP